MVFKAKIGEFLNINFIAIYLETLEYTLHVFREAVRGLCFKFLKSLERKSQPYRPNCKKKSVIV